MNDSFSTEVRSILQMGCGIVMERVDCEMGRVMANIMDPNTDPLKVRTITLKIKMRPDRNRQTIGVDIDVSSALAPATPASLSLLTGFENGRFVAVEALTDVPGQMRMAGDNEPDRVMLRFPDLSSGEMADIG